ncbi:MAG: YdeI/OmpD-associated family protein [Thermoclostridium sp.]|nr:YdeI/OmpD-associated family protein [Thermoclostridium sp.]
MEEQLLFTSRSEFRQWLVNHHVAGKGVWLVFGKNGKESTIGPEVALEEALCFGWIDGQIKRVDETKYMKWFSARRTDSVWSEKNRKTAMELIKNGFMTEAGVAAIEQAKKSGNWDVPKQEFTEDQIKILEEALFGHEPAYSNFMKMSFSVRRTYTLLYLDAKSEATKKKRLEQIVGRLNENKKPM